MGPFLQQVAAPCDACRGQGETMSAKDKCKSCNGNKIVQERKIFQVHVTPGMKHGEKIVFEDDGDEQPDLPPGDVIIILRQKPHAEFERKGQDLHMKLEITLLEALCGFIRIIKHLDDRELLIEMKPGEVMKPGAFKMIPKEGMCHPRHRQQKGNIVILFPVDFSEAANLSLEKVQILEQALGPRKKAKLDESKYESVKLVDVAVNDGSEGGRGRGGRREGFDDDDDDDAHQQGAQCHAQ
eukprot:Awhi_evm1s13352